MQFVGMEWTLWDTHVNFLAITTPQTPPTSQVKLYGKIVGGISTLCYENDAGSEFCLPTINPIGTVTGSGIANRLAFWTSATNISANPALTFHRVLVADTNGLPTNNAALTTGQVVFPDANGELAGDAKLFWDNTNKRLGIGNNAPRSALDIGDGLAGFNAIVNSSANTFSGYRIDRASAEKWFLGMTNSGNEEFVLRRSATTNDISISATTGVVNVSSVLDAATGYRIGGAAASGNVLRGNGTNFVSTTLALTDISPRAHSSLTGLTADDHTQYFLLAGRSGGQLAIGGTAASDPLTLQSTSHATRGTVKIVDILTSTTERSFLIGARNLSFPIIQEIGGTLSTATTEAIGLAVSTIFSGAGDLPLGLFCNPNFTPSASIGTVIGFLGAPKISPASGTTVTTYIGGYANLEYDGTTGAVTTGYSFFIDGIVKASTLVPSTQVGLFIGNQGASGITKTVGLVIGAQSGS